VQVNGVDVAGTSQIRTLENGVDYWNSTAIVTLEAGDVVALAYSTATDTTVTILPTQTLTTFRLD
jgi:hypothetical protein